MLYFQAAVTSKSTKRPQDSRKGSDDVNSGQMNRVENARVHLSNFLTLMLKLVMVQGFNMQVRLRTSFGSIR